MSKGKLYLKKKRKNRGFALRSLSLSELAAPMIN